MRYYTSIAIQDCILSTAAIALILLLYMYNGEIPQINQNVLPQYFSLSISYSLIVLMIRIGVITIKRIEGKISCVAGLIVGSCMNCFYFYFPSHLAKLCSFSPQQYAEYFAGMIIMLITFSFMTIFLEFVCGIRSRKIRKPFAKEI